MKPTIPQLDIKVIIGLGNPGPSFSNTRHNIGFEIVDLIAEDQQASWQTKENMELCKVNIEGKNILLVKPMTYMNTSGQVLSYLRKQGIQQNNILVVHDEIELPFGSIKLKFDGSAKGHNGLKSIMALGGSDFLRLRFGVDRPANREDVPNFVLEKFRESTDDVNSNIYTSVQMIQDYLSQD